MAGGAADDQDRIKILRAMHARYTRWAQPTEPADEIAERFGWVHE